jgi:translation initiation factor IF-2
MRLVQVAKILGITGQELRHELTQVDFGVRPTDREVTDNLAMGVIRFVATKRKINVDWEAVEAIRSGKQGDTEDEKEEEAAPAETGAAEPVVAKVQKVEGLNVLRKLTLENVSKEAVDRQKLALDRELKRPKVLSKEELEQRLVENKLLKQLDRKPKSENQEQIKQKSGSVMLPSSITVKEFAEKVGIQVPRVISSLMKNGVMASINQQIDFETASIVALELGVTVERDVGSVSVEALLRNDLATLTKEDDVTKLTPRAPIVTVMGHVDHGKTAILDAIRQTNVVAGEAGGITQHVGAYQVVHQGKAITFIDTPGHEAFTAMRARGAQLTDIAILVVSAEEGVKPTTIEAINHIKDAAVPIIVALNKIDRPNADPERVKGELAAQGLQAEGWGGTVPVIPCSALTKQGIPELLEHILLVAELEELTANVSRPAIATVIESHLDKSRGPLASVIVNAGTLAVGAIIGCGGVDGRIKAMFDERGDRIESVGPSGPAMVTGLSELPKAGDILQVFGSDRELKEYLAAYHESRGREAKRGFADLVSRLSEGKLKELKIILKADAQGSLESIQEAMKKLTTDTVHPKVIHAAVGSVTESDVMMAAAGNAIVVGFNADVPSAVHKTADREGVAVKQYDIIYKLLEDLELLLKGLVQPVEEERVTGHLEVRGVFFTKGSEQIIGGKVTDGSLKRTPFRLMRGEQLVGTGRITSLKHVEKDIKEAKEGSECGMRVTCNTTVETGDILEAFMKEFTKIA